jgi:steroid delta-isomerase-like uncharacterized protein
MSEQIKMLASRGIEEVWNRGNFEVVDEIIASDFAGHSSMGETHGPDEVKQFFMSLRSAFPDIKFSIEDQIAEGDMIATRWSARATHTGDFRGIPATGRPGTITGVSIYRVVNGKLVEGWTNLDELGLLKQLGVIPAPGTASV